MGVVLGVACALALFAGWTANAPAAAWWLQPRSGSSAAPSHCAPAPLRGRAFLAARAGLSPGGLVGGVAGDEPLTRRRHQLHALGVLPRLDGRRRRYFGGRAFGRRKLAPSISPGKSWEGVYSGIAGVLLLALFWAWLDRTLALDSPSLYTHLAQSLGLAGAALVLVALGSDERRRRPRGIARQARRGCQGFEPAAARARRCGSIASMRCCRYSRWRSALARL